MDMAHLKFLVENNANLVLSYDEKNYQKLSKLAEFCYERGVTLTLKVSVNDFKKSPSNIKSHLADIASKGHKFVTIDISE
ncbi:MULTISPECIES: hypothetical protein [Glaesserella]|uniref:Uncharacterized protein n=1 Tax=Glaesserella australis TaxID=2094024 RepID=A0A328BZ33_9PAST|nr:MULTISPECIES: hypothetical protein [Glaesserella]AUI66534.1 hypothetical protein CJD39_08070 [Glaesserella sp. 15-184]RAL18707.1 hypothetical protein C5N92_06090 [Glaesserella australis]